VVPKVEKPAVAAIGFQRVVHQYYYVTVFISFDGLLERPHKFDAVSHVAPLVNAGVFVPVFEPPLAVQNDECQVFVHFDLLGPSAANMGVPQLINVEFVLQEILLAVEAVEAVFVPVVVARKEDNLAGIIGEGIGLHAQRVLSRSPFFATFGRHTAGVDIITKKYSATCFRRLRKFGFQ
jgi:hypothetical protein